jgi:hypothetical protein
MLPIEEGTLPGGRVRYGLVSPIAWSSDSKRLAVVDHEGESNWLVLVDISKGLHQPSILTVPIARELFLQPRLLSIIPREYPYLFVIFRELRFSDDGQSVVLKPWEFDPFVDRAVTIAVPPANR